MKITIGGTANNGMIEVRVTYYEQVDGLGQSGDVLVWVPDHDSRAEIKKSARIAAAAFLTRALQAHSSPDPA